ncbi:hypothetical protein BOX15_Mlig013498g1 [Macrostomum lignano]|uniref:Uncharacterized protein n=1 Tax=Macrostomum lignano TaxID=282301 RepID=A0A267FB20_9PLAT|nr:hypothetical protein BOX15_Mlig013498g1 [Macrostomum lignano]
MQNQERVEMRIWLQVVPREEALQYWQERLRLVEASSSENSDRSQQILRRAVCHVMLGLHYLLMQNLSDAKTIQQKFMNLLGRNAIKDLWSYITCSDSEKYSEQLNKYLANFNFNEEKSVLYFVTVVFIANEGQMALRDPKRCGSWAWFWLVESAQRLGKICLQSKEIGPEMTACVRFSIGSLLLNCASVKDVYAHKYLLKSFSHFQAAIERRMRKGLTRRIDAEIVLNEQSMVAIVNMATCFLELRQMDKCTALICQARLLLGKSTILDELSKHYLSAFIDYVDGVNDFERTSPLHSKLNAGSVILNARELRELYDSALEKLTRSAYRLRQSFSKSTIFASTLTMLGIVTANRTAEFNDTSLAYLQEAVQVEMALSQRSNTMRYLLQTISVAAGLFENDESAIALRWKELHSSVKSLHHNDLSATKEEHPIAGVSDVDFELNRLSSSSTVSLLPLEAAETAEHQNPSLPLVDLRFTDCYRQDCLDYFRRRLRECIATDSALAAILCRLFIARFHLIRCAIDLAGVEQNAVQELLSQKFSLHISRQSSFKLSQLRRKLQRGEVAEMAEAVAICCAFWQANEAKFVLLGLQLGKNWRLNRSSPVGYSVNSPKTGRYIRENWYSFTDSVLLRFWSDNWRLARCLMNNSRKLSNELRGAFEASAAWFHLGAVLDSSLAEVCVDLNELLPSKMLRSGQIKRCAKSLIQSLQSWLPKLDNGLSDPVFALAGHRIAILDDALGATNDIMNSSDNITTVLDLNQDYVNVELLPMPKPKRRLAPFQEAYDSCTSTGLLDTPLHACVHLSTAVILYKSAVKDLTKPAYSQYNAAVLKLRRASRVLELLEPLHPLTGDCYALLAVMYYNMMQLEDQEEKALNCLRACLKIQRNLIANGCATSCWAWRSIDVARN